MTSPLRARSSVDVAAAEAGSPPRESRVVLAADAARLRQEGLTGIQVAERLGISRSYAYSLLNDPDGSGDRERKRRYDLVCTDCGARVDGTTPGKMKNRDEPRCAACAAVKRGAEMMIWTEQRVISAIRQWAAEQGEPPAMRDWNPTAAREVGDEERARRFEAARGRWPSVQSVVNRFGCWNAAVEAAGFGSRRPHGGGDNVQRRRNIVKGQERDEIIRLYLAGHSSIEVARRLGRSSNTVLRVLKNAGVLRSQSDAQRFRHARRRASSPLSETVAA